VSIRATREGGSPKKRKREKTSQTRGLVFEVAGGKSFTALKLMQGNRLRRSQKKKAGEQGVPVTVEVGAHRNIGKGEEGKRMTLKA